MRYSRATRGAVILCTFLILIAGAFATMAVHLNPVSYAQGTPSFGNLIDLSNDTYNAQYPMVATSGNNVYVVWTEASHGIYIRTSSNDGFSFNPSVRLSLPGGVAGFPVITANGSNVYVAWPQTVPPNNVSQIYFTSSTEYGANFLTPQILSQSTNSITAAIAGWGSVVYVSWAGDTPTNNGTYIRSSTDNGTNFGTTTPISVGTHENEIAAYGSYAYAVADEAFAYTNDNGATWHKVGTAIGGSEVWVAASGSHVYIASELKNLNKTSPINMQVSGNHGKSFGPVFNPNGAIINDWEPQLAASGNNVYLAFRSLGSNVTIPPITISAWVTVSNNFGANWSTPYEMSLAGHQTGWPLDIAISGSNAFSIYGSATVSNGTTWNAYVSFSTDNGITWTPSPGVDVSQNNMGVAAPDTDIASASIKASGTYGFAAWMANGTTINSTNFQIYFNGPPPIYTTTTSSSSSSSMNTTSSSSQSTTSSESSTSYSISNSSISSSSSQISSTSLSSATSSTAFSNLSSTSSSSSGSPSGFALNLVQDSLIAIGVVVAVTVGLLVLRLRRR